MLLYPFRRCHPSHRLVFDVMVMFPLGGEGGDVSIYNFPRLKSIERIEYIEGYGRSEVVREGLCGLGLLSCMVRRPDGL